MTHASRAPENEQDVKTNIRMRNTPGRVEVIPKRKTEARKVPSPSLSFKREERREAVDSNLVDSASSHTLVSKIKPCMSKYK